MPVLAGALLLSGAIARADDETVMARMAKIAMPDAIAAAVAKAPGRVAWASRERSDGKLLYMVQVVGADRASTLVSLDARTGRVVKAEPMPAKSEESEGDKKEAERKKNEKGKDSGPSPVKGSLPIAGAKPEEFPYLAKVSLAEAMKTANAKVRGRFVEVYAYESAGTLLYGVEITGAPGKITLIQVDAGSGEVLGTIRM